MLPPASRVACLLEACYEFLPGPPILVLRVFELHVFQLFFLQAQMPVVKMTRLFQQRYTLSSETDAARQEEML